MRQALSDAVAFSELADSQPAITTLAERSVGFGGSDSVEDNPSDLILAGAKQLLSEQGQTKDFRQALIDYTRTPEGAKAWKKHRLAAPAGSVDASTSTVTVTRD